MSRGAAFQAPEHLFEIRRVPQKIPVLRRGSAGLSEGEYGTADESDAQGDIANGVSEALECRLAKEVLVCKTLVLGRIHPMPVTLGIPSNNLPDSG